MECIVCGAGGMAGMQAAITAAERGHKVTLVEKSDKLGGLLYFTDVETLTSRTCAISRI